MSDSIDIVYRHVREQIDRGITIDVYRVARAFEQNFQGMTIEDIAQLVTAAVANRGGNAVWDPASKSKGS